MLFFKRIAIILFCVLALFSWLVFSSAGTRIYSNQGGSVDTVVRILPGRSATFFLAQLHTEYNVKVPRLLKYWLHFSGRASRLKSGEYQVNSSMSFRDLFNAINKGQVVYYSFRVVEGERVEDLLHRLSEDKHLVHLINPDQSAQLLLKLPYTHLEGLFFPDTYKYAWPSTDVDLLKRAYAQMRRELNLSWQERKPLLPYKNPYQMLIMASIIEKEGSNSLDRQAIAGVLVRRLKKGMRLQVDPTVAYGLGFKTALGLTKKNLATITPYNTYRKQGLPPTPIALPSQGALYAAANPSQGQALFYVAKGDGSHVFSNTYKEHLEAINTYLRKKPKPVKRKVQ